MGTRAIITFIDNDNDNPNFNVYQHWDGDPTGVLPLLGRACAKAWALNRFEADEFAAAFVATAKTGEGNIRLLPAGRWEDVAPADVEYCYTVIQCNSGHVLVRCQSVDYQGKAWGAAKWKVTGSADVGLKELRAAFCPGYTEPQPTPATLIALTLR